MNKVEDILVKHIEDIKVGRPAAEDYWDKYLSLCGELEPILRLKLGIPNMRGNIVEEV